MKKTYRIKTNNQEQFQRKQNESDATSKWIKFQKTRPRRRIQDKDVPVLDFLYVVDQKSNIRFLLFGILSTGSQINIEIGSKVNQKLIVWCLKD